MTAATEPDRTTLSNGQELLARRHKNSDHGGDANILAIHQFPVPYEDSLAQIALNIEKVSDFESALKSLYNADWDLIFIDDYLVDVETIQIIGEIRRRLPVAGLLIISHNLQNILEADLLKAGVNDILLHDHPHSDFLRRIELTLKLVRHERTLVRRNKNLHAISQLSNRFLDCSNPEELIFETVRLVSFTFELYGMVVVLKSGSKLHMFAGDAELSTLQRMYQSTFRPRNFDPFYYTCATGITQLYQDIRLHPDHVSIPPLSNASATLILPLEFQDDLLGAVGLFARDDRQITSDDVIVFQLLANQFAVAYHNVSHYYAQTSRVKVSTHLLRAWQAFAKLHVPAEVAEELRKQIEAISSVGRCLVWIYAEPSTTETDIIIDTSHTEGEEIFLQLRQAGHISSLIEQFGEQLQPITILLGRGRQDPFGPLFRAFQARQLVIVPITDSARFIGGIIIANDHPHPPPAEDMHLMTALTHAAGQSLERATLIGATSEQSGRLEVILRGIHEGVVFIDDAHQVRFCNPQFTELTDIMPSEVVNRNFENLVEHLSSVSHDDSKIYNQLTEAVELVTDPEVSPTQYPIVELHLNAREQGIFVSFVRIPSPDKNRTSWLGIVQDSERFTQLESGISKHVLDAVSERMLIPLTQLRNSVNTLSEQHKAFSTREREIFLREVSDNVDEISNIWSNFSFMNKLAQRELTLIQEEVDLFELITRVVMSPQFYSQRARIRVDKVQQLSTVKIDVRSFTRALVNILHNAIKYSTKESPIRIRLHQENHQIIISVQDQGTGIPKEELEKIFDLNYQSELSNDQSGYLGLYVSRELILQQGGELRVESVVGTGSNVIISLPLPKHDNNGGPLSTEKIENHIETDRVPVRTPKNILVIKGRSKIATELTGLLEVEGYGVFTGHSGEGASKDLAATRFDLIILDVNLADEDGFIVCEQIRAQTETPILMVSDDSSDQDVVRGLHLGADDFIANPKSEAELLARVQVIFSRQMIPDRSREPLFIGELRIDFAKRQVFLSGQPVGLSRIEYEVLRTLATNKDQVLTHKQLLQKVWGPEYDDETQYLWVTISRLRKKLEPLSESPRYIHTQSGIGYVLREP